MDADLGRCAKKSLAAGALLAPVGCGQAAEGGASGVHAQITKRDL